MSESKSISKTNISSYNSKLSDYFSRFISDTESKILEKELDFTKKEWTKVMKWIKGRTSKNLVDAYLPNDISEVNPR